MSLERLSDSVLQFVRIEVFASITYGSTLIIGRLGILWIIVILAVVVEVTR